MASNKETHLNSYSLKILVTGGGNVSNVSHYLTSLNSAYTQLYLLDKFLDIQDTADFVNSKLDYRKRDTNSVRRKLETIDLHSRFHQQRYISIREPLILRKVAINSPGFWEFIGALNPLEQLRRYLNERHERRKDMLWRNNMEKESDRLKNELIRNKILKERYDILAKKVKLLKDSGFEEEEIQRFVSLHIDEPLNRLATYQDDGMIINATAEHIF